MVNMGQMLMAAIMKMTARPEYGLLNFLLSDIHSTKLMND
ncbi:hypothetical protein NT6N_26580 [Oceaniferula spumae]|uniref:Uncharacterized protein n=1 Tax=Oceaniferula spumae TaxID=2979115 RepID=A0AAT9FNU4_9BACT